MNNNELRHHGVKGMKWGVRKVIKQTSKNNSENQDHTQEHRRNSYKKNDVKTMTDAELNRAINRLRMEMEYSRLTQRDISSGRKFVNDVLKKSSKTVATKYATKAMSAGIDKAIAAAVKKK